jgi:uncharacterized protein (TIGR00106 family)
VTGEVTKQSRKGGNEIATPRLTGTGNDASGGHDRSGNYKKLEVSGGERMAIAEISIIPLGTKTPSVSRYVARAVKVLQQEKGIKYEMTAMGTIVEGDLDRILYAVKKMHEAAFGEGIARVITMVEIDERRDKAQDMKKKLDSLKKKL